MGSSQDSIQDQIAYYRERASEYDQWFLRQGRYDHGEAQNQQWFAEVEQVREALARYNPTGRVLEFAGGTGWWTQELARFAENLTVVDSSPETIALNRERLATSNARNIPV